MADGGFLSFTVGDAIALTSVIGGVIVVTFHIGSKTRAIESAAKSTQEDISELKEGVKKVVDIMINLARQNERLDMLDRRLDDIVRGRVRIVHSRGEVQ